jgi:hypothetical protein
LNYSEEGSAVNFNHLTKQFRDAERPFYILEEKKLNDIIEGLVEVTNHTIEKQKEDMSQVYKKSLNSTGNLSRPVLSLMMWGPQCKNSHNTSNGLCILEVDSWNRHFLNEHMHVCAEFEDFHHWRYSHDQKYPCANVSTLSGPAIQHDLTMVYPCNIGMCCLPCQCRLCANIKKNMCSLENHKMHMKNFDISCVVQQDAQCQEHWVTHPDNFNVEEDILVEKNIFFHNGELVEQPRNHTLDIIKFSGIKKKCKRCRENVYDHFRNHHDIHACCKFCSFQLATLKDSKFWEKVCNTCGKVLECPKSLKWHKKIHINSNFLKCHLCNAVLHRKFTYWRHMEEKHQEKEEDENIETKIVNNFVRQEEPHHECEICGQFFPLKRYLLMHIHRVHEQTKKFECTDCAKSYKFKRNLKHHMLVVHKKTDSHLLGGEQKYVCPDCGKEFTRKDSLKAHIRYFHSEQKKMFSCDFCDAKFLKKSNLNRHIKQKHI